MSEQRTCRFCGTLLPGEPGICMQCGAHSDDPSLNRVAVEEGRDPSTGELLPPQKREGFFGALTTAGKIGLAVLAVLVIAAIVLLVLFAN